MDFTDDPEDQDSSAEGAFSNDVSEGAPAEEEFLASLGIIEPPFRLSGEWKEPRDEDALNPG